MKSLLPVFMNRNRIGRDWKPIVVPGQWSQQGLKVDSAGFGGYQTTFTLPADWQGKQVKLRFDGVSSESVVYLNGKEIGSHMGGMTAFELDVTKGLKAGEKPVGPAGSQRVVGRHVREPDSICGTSVGRHNP